MVILDDDAMDTYLGDNKDAVASTYYAASRLYATHCTYATVATQLISFDGLSSSLVIDANNSMGVGISRKQFRVKYFVNEECCGTKNHKR